VAWPTPRFTDNNNGTVTDNLTRLIWTKNADAFSKKTWADALTAANSLQADQQTGLTDGSKAGDWRLPNRKELESLVDCSRYHPLPADHPFTNVWSLYWSSSTYAYNIACAWGVDFVAGAVNFFDKGTNAYVWCVRAGP
jgi:hypothetical protein